MTTPTLLATIQRVNRRLGLPSPGGTIIADTSNLQDQQMWEIANDVGTDLMRSAIWPFLRKVCTITTVDATATYTISVGSGNTTYTCDRLIPDVQYDDTNGWRFLGDVGDDIWYAYQYDLVTTPIRRIWRMVTKTSIEIFPIPTADDDGETLAVPFVTDKWVVNSGATAYTSAFAADSDTHLFDWDLFDLGVVWRFLEAKGLNYAGPLKRYNEELDRRIAHSRNPGRLSLNSRRGTRLISHANVPDTGYGS